MTSRGHVEHTAGGRAVVTFVRELEHPVNQVWNAITQAEHLSRWFPAEVELTLEVGARLSFLPTAEQRARYGATDADAVAGIVTAVEPSRLLEFTWGTDLLRWELAGDTSHCRLTFRHEVGDVDEARAHLAGWHCGLDALAAGLRGEAFDPWADLERYVDLYR